MEAVLLALLAVVLAALLLLAARLRGPAAPGEQRGRGAGGPWAVRSGP